MTLNVTGNTSFTQANLQHIIAASRLLTTSGNVQGTDMALIPEPWYCEDCISVLNISGYTAGGINRPRACIPARNMTTGKLPGFSCRGLIAVLNYNENWAERRLILYSAYLPYDAKDPPHQRNYRNSCAIVRAKTSS